MLDSPDTSPQRADDDEWIKSVVARALLEETRSEETPPAPAPVAPPRPAMPMPPLEGNWPDAMPLDTASIRSRAAAAVEANRRLAEGTSRDTGHGVGLASQDHAEATLDHVPQPAVSDTAPAAVAAAVPEVTHEVPTPHVVSPPSGLVAEEPPAFDVAPITRDEPPQPQELAPFIEQPAFEPDHLGAVTTPTQRSPEPTAAPIRDADIEPARVDAGFEMPRGVQDGVHPADEVMVEEPVSTDGYRSSDLRTILEWLAVIVSALAVALLIKAFVLQAFWIPSPSMETTVNEGDRILVNKLSYRLHEVRRGDLIVFKRLEGTPGDTDDLIKRAIALPGETIEVRDDGRIWIWGPGEGPEQAKLLEEPYLDPQNSLFATPSASDPVSVDIWDDGCVNNRTPGRCTLDDASFFVLGDNRNRSADSRFFGPIPEENVVGRAFFRIWPLGDISTL